MVSGKCEAMLGTAMEFELWPRLGGTRTCSAGGGTIVDVEDKLDASPLGVMVVVSSKCESVSQMALAVGLHLGSFTQQLTASSHIASDR